MKIRPYLYVLFLISLCINSVVYAEDTDNGQTITPQMTKTDAWLYVLTAHTNYLDASGMVETLERNKGDLEIAVNDVRRDIDNELILSKT